jgi:hypothetical protein
MNESIENVCALDECNTITSIRFNDFESILAESEWFSSQ